MPLRRRRVRRRRGDRPPARHPGGGPARLGLAPRTWSAGTTATPTSRTCASRSHHERVVVVGNGNVALDVARILTTDPEDLATTDIAALPLGDAEPQPACARWWCSAAAARPTPRSPCPSWSGWPGIDGPQRRGRHRRRARSPATPRSCGCSPSSRPGRRVAARRTLVLRFRTTPERILGDRAGHRRGGRPRRRRPSVIECGLVLRAIGYHGEPVAGPSLRRRPRARSRNDRGRVRPGVYVAGWVKRGPTGFIGTNKSCAQETVERILDDIDAGALPAPTRTRDDLATTLESRGVDPDRRRPAGGRSTTRSAAAGCSADGRGSSWWTPRSCAGWRRDGSARPGYSSARRRRQKRG